MKNRYRISVSESEKPERRSGEETDYPEKSAKSESGNRSVFGYDR
jgi:hypothetical protein